MAKVSYFFVYIIVDTLLVNNKIMLLTMYRM